MKKILFIEDESALQKTFRVFIEQEGYKMVSALDGESGFNLAKLEKPDLILLDLILPRLNGFEVLEKLKEDYETKEIPVIILTNLENPDDINKALELGAKTYLVKSNYTLSELVEKVKKALEEER
ncbi:MAG: response regulator [Candidatus Nealsonbacteria bacterium]|nr:response regulator [Candidatus Nealsonbacteria bacterium]